MKNFTNHSAHRLGRILVPVVVAILSGCATHPAATFEPFTPQDLNSKLRAGLYEQKVDNFLVIMDASSSMNETYEGSGFTETTSATKFSVEKEFLSRMNQTIPDLKLNYGLRTFGFGPCLGWHFTHLNAAMTAYSQPAFQSTVDSLACAGGGSPIGEALDAAAEDLAASQGNIAVILLSDGKQAGGQPREAAAKLKQQYGDRLCLHTVWTGNPDEPGQTLMGSLPAVAGCGTESRVGDIVSSAAMAGFVETVFLAKGNPVLDSDGDGVLDPDDQCPGTPKGAKVNQVGCWVLANLLFETDKSIIQPVSYPELAQVVTVFEKNPGLRVEVQGHTDSVGSDAHNLQLSQRRAEAVRAYLVDHGIAANRLMAQGFGETDPVASNNTEAGRALNRRVELKVLR